MGMQTLSWTDNEIKGSRTHRNKKKAQHENTAKRKGVTKKPQGAKLFLMWMKWPLGKDQQAQKCAAATNGDLHHHCSLVSLW